MTLRDYCARWLRTRTARLAPNSVRAYRSVLMQHVLPALGADEMHEITAQRVRGFLGDQLAAGKPRCSVQGFHAALSTVLTDAVIDGCLASNPAHGASRRLWPRRGPVIRGLPLDDLHALLLAADLDRVRWFGTFCRILVRTGLRLGEGLALKPEDCLVDAVRIDRTYHGAGRFGPPKGGRSRIVQVDDATIALYELRARQGGPFLFTSRDGRLPWSLTHCDDIMARVVVTAGLPETVTLHSLRHTYATLLLDDGCDLAWLKAQMGHASVAITADLYGAGSHGRRPELLRGLNRTEPTRHLLRPALTRRIIPFRSRRAT